MNIPNISNTLDGATAPSHTHTDAHADTLRRQLQAEFQQIEQVIRDAVVLDPLTEEIALWLNHFRHALRTSANAEEVYRTYVELLQEMLRDPVTQAPLDEYALLGVEDGCTYGKMSIAVTRAALPASQRDLSPMTGQPLTLIPHPLARFMVQWLGRRGEALYSEELERTYLQLLSQEREISLEDRVAHLMQRHVQREQQREQEREQEQISEIQRLQERMARMEREHASDMQRLNARIGRLSEPLQQVQQEIQQVASLPTIPIAAVQQQMQRIIQQQFTPLEQHVREYANQQLSRLAQVEAQERQRLVQLEQAIALTENQVGQVDRENKKLKQEQESLQQNVEQLEQTQAQLDRNIQHLHAIITRNKQRRKNKLKQNIRAVACIALSVVATWGLACLEIPISVNIATQGVGAAFGYSGSL